MNERILNLLSLCMQAKEKGESVFFDYSPHVDMVSIWCYEDIKKAMAPKYGDEVKYKFNLVFYIVPFANVDSEEITANIDLAELHLKELITNGKPKID